MKSKLIQTLNWADIEILQRISESLTPLQIKTIATGVSDR
jgi:hypothetical protein